MSLERAFSISVMAIALLIYNSKRERFASTPKIVPQNKAVDIYFENFKRIIA